MKLLIVCQNTYNASIAVPCAPDISPLSVQHGTELRPIVCDIAKLPLRELETSLNYERYSMMAIGKSDRIVND